MSRSRRASLHVVEGAAANHVMRVLRLRDGDPLTLFDGRGGEYGARIAAFASDSVQVGCSSRPRRRARIAAAAHAGAGHFARRADGLGDAEGDGARRDAHRSRAHRAHVVKLDERQASASRALARHRRSRRASSADAIACRRLPQPLRFLRGHSARWSHRPRACCSRRPERCVRASFRAAGAHRDADRAGRRTFRERAGSRDRRRLPAGAHGPRSAAHRDRGDRRARRPPARFRGTSRVEESR